MTPRIFIILALWAAVPVWAQTTGAAQPGSEEQADNPVANEGMLTPPPVSGQSYPVLTAAEERKNYVSLGATANVAYDDNVGIGSAGQSNSDMIYSIWPTVSLNRNSARLHETFNYSPGFTLYHPTSAYNLVDQNVRANFQYVMGTHTNLVLQDNFDRSSSLFNQPFATAEGDITGGVPTQTSGAVVAFANRIVNSADARVTTQPSENGMVGLSADYGQLDYPDPKQTFGLYDATSYDGGAFATQRLTRNQYLGANLEHARIVSELGTTDNVIKRDNIFGFYTIYLRNQLQSTLSLSFTGGPEHYSIAQYPEALISKWTPSGTASVGWQSRTSSASASVSRAITGGGGLPGAYEEESVQVTFRQQIRRTWDLNASGLYFRNKSETPGYQFSEPGGHTFAASASANHMVSKNIKISFGYDWMDQDYKAVTALSQAPVSNREYGAISYQITRPVGR